MKNYPTDVVILGAGAAGLMCAMECGKRGFSVTVIEKSAKPGRKILISGGGRCNFTNMYTTPENYISDNPHFCKSALSRYTPWDFIALMEKHDLSWTEKKLGQLFCDQKAGAVVSMLLDECKNAGVRVLTSTEVTGISFNDRFSIASDNHRFDAKYLVIATGGPSIPKMGSTDFSQQVAKQFGLKTVPFKPALVPLTFSETQKNKLFKDLSGLSTEAIVSCNGTSFRENLLLTHRGLSGPAILQISSYWQKGDSLSINLFPDNNALEELRQCCESHPDSLLSTTLSHYLPKRFAQRLCELYFENKPLKQYHQSELESIATLLTEWRLTPDGSEGMRTAEVSSGGVSCDELSSKTFESRKVPGLYFIGESIDVTGHLGGFNFQWAWASGWCCGRVHRKLISIIPPIASVKQP